MRYTLSTMQEALNVIIKKFSDSCGVVKCVIDFFKSIASAEETYAASISRLTKNGIPFRSTIFMRLFEMEPHQELQYVFWSMHV